MVVFSSLIFFVHDGLNSVADYNSLWVGVGWMDFVCRCLFPGKFHDWITSTDEAIIEGVEPPKSLAPPLQPTGVIGFGHMGYRFNPWFDRIGATEAIF